MNMKWSFFDFNVTVEKLEKCTEEELSELYLQLNNEIDKIQKLLDNCNVTEQNYEKLQKMADREYVLRQFRHEVTDRKIRYRRRHMNCNMNALNGGGVYCDAIFKDPSCKRNIELHGIRL